MSFRPFQLRPGEELRTGLPRIVTRIVKQSATLPRFRAGKAEEAVHKARLLVKLLRALVWMAHPALGGAVCRRIRSHLRAAARSLADLRDAAVLVSTLSKLTRKVSRHQQRTDYAPVANAVARSLPISDDVSVRHKLSDVSRHLEQVNVLFGRAAEKTARPWPSAAKRERASARSCLKAMKRALSTGDAVDFHEWRKKAKRLLFQLRVAEIAPGPSMREVAELVDKLQSKLGDHHDLVVLEEHLRKNFFNSNRPDSARKVLGHIRRQRKALEKQLGPLGRRWSRA